MLRGDKQLVKREYAKDIGYQSPVIKRILCGMADMWTSPRPTRALVLSYRYLSWTCMFIRDIVISLCLGSHACVLWLQSDEQRAPHFYRAISPLLLLLLYLVYLPSPHS